MTRLTINLEEIKSILENLEYQYTVLDDKRTTICSAYMQNGYRIAIGESACMNLEDFSEGVGQVIARKKCDAAAEDFLYKVFAFNAFYNKKD